MICTWSEDGLVGLRAELVGSDSTSVQMSSELNCIVGQLTDVRESENGLVWGKNNNTCLGSEVFWIKTVQNFCHLPCFPRHNSGFTCCQAPFQTSQSLLFPLSSCPFSTSHIHSSPSAKSVWFNRLSECPPLVRTPEVPCLVSSQYLPWIYHPRLQTFWCLVCNKAWVPIRQSKLNLKFSWDRSFPWRCCLTCVGFLLCKMGVDSEAYFMVVVRINGENGDKGPGM